MPPPMLSSTSFLTPIHTSQFLQSCHFGLQNCKSKVSKISESQASSLFALLGWLKPGLLKGTAPLGAGSSPKLLPVPGECPPFFSLFCPPSSISVSPIISDCPEWVWATHSCSISPYGSLCPPPHISAPDPCHIHLEHPPAWAWPPLPFLARPSESFSLWVSPFPDAFLSISPVTCHHSASAHCACCVMFSLFSQQHSLGEGRFPCSVYCSGFSTPSSSWHTDSLSQYASWMRSLLSNLFRNRDRQQLLKQSAGVERQLHPWPTWAFLSLNWPICKEKINAFQNPFLSPRIFCYR